MSPLLVRAGCRPAVEHVVRVVLADDEGRLDDLLLAVVDALADITVHADDEIGKLCSIAATIANRLPFDDEKIRMLNDYMGYGFTVLYANTPDDKGRVTYGLALSFPEEICSWD